MYLSKFQVKNYKSFRDSGEIEFKQGINIIVGQNNSGKTALLEAIEMKSSDNPHISINTKKIRSDSNAKATIILKENEVVNYIEKSEPYYGNDFYLKDFSISPTVVEEIINNLIEKGGELDIDIKFRYGNSISHNLYEKNYSGMYKFVKNENNTYSFSTKIVNNQNKTLWETLEKVFEKQIYRFNAERLALKECPAGLERELKADASNLAEVLANTQENNRSNFEIYNKHVSQVFPFIKWISSVGIPQPKEAQFSGKYNQIRIRNFNESIDREDLNFPLSSCGTGIGQVLAILYVVITSLEPKILLIDEPNSFLHPSASKKLIQILNQFPQHQYFISTHSPEIFATANASTITMLKYEDGETKVQKLNLSQGSEKLKLVKELGMEMSDFFFAENILWVEGPTEAKCFPLILKKSKSLLNVVAVPLVSTGDITDRKYARKHARTNIENHRRLSGEYALTPPKIFTILDREDTSDQEITELEKLGIKFIKRRMFENYLIDTEAIKALLNYYDIEIEAENIDKWLAEKKTAKEFLDKDDKNCGEAEWINKVHGANLLHQLCIEFSDSCVQYKFDKPKFGEWLTEWFLANKPEQLQELQDFLEELLKEKEAIR